MGEGVEFRIEKIDDDGEITGALVFSPAPATGAAPRFSIERFGRENNQLGPHGWTVNAPPLVPRAAELRGGELWLLFGNEVSYWIDPGTAVLVRLAGTAVEGSDVWPPIPRGKAPPAPPRVEATPPPAPAVAPPRAEPDAAAPEPSPDPAPAPTPAPPPPSPMPAATLPQPFPTGDPGPGGSTTGGTAGGGGIRASEWITVAVALLLGLGAAGAWWFWPRPERVPEPPTERADPPPRPVPAADPCLEVDQVLDGACPRERLRELTPEQATRLARALIERGGRTANDLAVSLLVGTVARSGHGEAALVLARLYDPHGFRQGGPLSAPNRSRALDLYRQAVAGGAAGAQEALEAFRARLRSEAEGGGPAAAEAAELLRRDGGG